MNIFIDANILVSVLNKEYPLFTYSARILSLADSRKFRVYTSPVCLAIAFYFAEKKSGTRLAKKKISLLVEKTGIADCTNAEVRQAAVNEAVKDFEDGIEYYSALRANCQCIITEDVNDFYFSHIEVLDSQSFLEKYVMRL